MNFKEVLNKYLKELNCSSKKLSNESGLSESVISRYRSGERTPVKNSEQLNKLTNALFNIAKDNNKNKYTFDKIESDFNSTLASDDFDYTTFSNNLNTLITSLNINTHEMSKYIVFDASHISRIRYGKAKPSNPVEFSNKICSYILNRYKNPDDINNLMMIIGCKKSDLSNEKIYSTLFNWLTSEIVPVKNQISDFLHHLDSFNLDDYIKVIKFDELKVPSIPFYKAKTKHYYGIEEMKQGELNFFKGTVLSKSKEDIFMCSDMPMEDMAKDIDFGKKWMFAIAMCLKKGHHLNIIHNLDRPFNEMMLGLESWIPIYMTGQISPYYLSNLKNNIYNHLNYVSAAAALSGECINGFHNKGMYYLTTNKNEIEYYKEKSDLLLKKAKPLMEIYRESNIKEYHLFLKKDENIECDRTRYISSLPLFTISDELLIKILKRNKLTKEEIDKIIKYKNNEFKYMNSILKKNKVFDYIYVIKEDEFISDTPSLLLNNLFIDKTINYTYKEYIEHLKLTNEYAKNNKNYNILTEKDKTFKNITITILKNNHVIISKNSNPTIHFVIRHPKLVAAIESFNPLVKEL
ncbi:putative phage tail component domain protein [Clostridium sp. CAG:302]|nr:putative phage tail component domain protein [Clostridium sp. CAG:302]CDE39152.1 putative phage tail component domain protein [Firmicutes bacterium CAG:321]